NTPNARPTFTPGVSSGTSTIDWRRYGSALGLVSPITIAILQRRSIAPDVHHLRPLMTEWSPSRLISARILVASDDATAGSVIAKQERISPSMSGLNQRSLCASLP